MPASDFTQDSEVNLEDDEKANENLPPIQKIKTISTRPKTNQMTWK
jgi:hypothetical protein